MDPQRYADKLISEAIERGELEPRDGLGKPLENLVRDPNWWVKGLLEREALPEQRADLDTYRIAQLEKAIDEPDLATARATLSALNQQLEVWNTRVTADLRLDVFDEIWLLDQRAGRPIN